MQGDLPHTLYIPPKKGKGKAAKGPYRYNPNDPAIAKQEEANRRAAERRAARLRMKEPDNK